MKKITEIERLLIEYLKILRASEATKAITFITLSTDDQMIEMCDYLSKNEEATDKEISAMAQRIAEKT